MTQETAAPATFQDELLDIIDEPVDAIPENTQVAMYDTIQTMAMDPDVSVEKLDGLLNFQERILDRQAKMDFNTSMVQLRKKLGPVLKTKKNNQTGSKYADLGAIKKAVDPLLEEFGFYDSYDDDFPEDGVIITHCTITHEGGHSRTNKVRFKRDDAGIKGTKNKTEIHGDASTMTYGQRLSLCRALGIRIADDDDGNAAGGMDEPTLNNQQFNEVMGLIDATDSDIKAFCGFMEVEAIKDIKQINYQRAINQLENKKRIQQEKKGN